MILNISKMFTTVSYTMTVCAIVVQAILLLLSLGARFVFGSLDYDSAVDLPSGRYGVGYARTWTKKDSMHMVVYYPIKDKKNVPLNERPPYKLWGVGTRGDNEEAKTLAWGRGGPDAVRGKSHE